MFTEVIMRGLTTLATCTIMSGAALLTVLLAQSGATQQRATETTGKEWPMYRHDLAGTGYSPLTQINVYRH